MVTGLKGEVELKRAGEKSYRRLTSTTSLGRGDSLRLGQDARALLLREDAAAQALKGARTVVITGKPTRAGGSLRKVEQVMSSASRTAGMVVRNEGDEEPRLLILTPRQSRLLVRCPQIRWTAVEGAKNYLLSVLDEKEETVFPPVRVTGTAYVVPANRPLAPGRYFIEIKTQDGAGRRLFAAATFFVASTQAAAQTKREIESAKKAAIVPGAPNMLLIVTLLEHAQLDEAERQLAAALKDSPDDVALHRLLAEVYRRMNRPFDQLRALKAAGQEAEER
jgi:hypothetical protein